MMSLHNYLGGWLFVAYVLFYPWLCWVLLAVQAFSGCGRRGLLSSCGAGASHCGGFSCCGAWALGTRASVVMAPRH